MSLLIVGSVALDTVETPKGKVNNSLGGSATYFSLSASHFTRVKLVAVVGEDFPSEYIHLFKTKGINIDGLKTIPGQTFRWKGRYHGSMNEAQTLDTQLNVFEQFSPSLPEEYKREKLVFLGNINPQLQLNVLDQMRHTDFVAMDTMNFWIEGELDALKAVLNRVDAVVINEAELRLLSGLVNMPGSVEKLLALGPKYVVIKRGEYGVVISDGEKWFFVPGYPEKDVTDPTGAGDSFAGGFMGYLAKEQKIDWPTLKRAVIYGSVMASFNITQFGPQKLIDLNWDQISSRFSVLTDFFTL